MQKSVYGKGSSLQKNSVMAVVWRGCYENAIVGVNSWHVTPKQIDNFVSNLNLLHQVGTSRPHTCSYPKGEQWVTIGCHFMTDCLIMSSSIKEGIYTMWVFSYLKLSFISFVLGHTFGFSLIIMSEFCLHWDSFFCCSMFVFDENFDKFWFYFFVYRR